MSNSGVSKTITFKKMNRIFIMDEHAGKSTPDLQKITKELIIVHQAEKQLLENLQGTISELYFFKEGFSQRMNHILKIGKLELDHFIPEIQTISSESEVMCELMDSPLSAYFKSFLVFVKSALDKMIKLYNFRHKSGKSSFESEGKKLLKHIHAKFTGKNKKDLIEMIYAHKKSWIDDTLRLRHEFTHNSNLREYVHFHVVLGKKNDNIKSITDFQKPVIAFNGKVGDAKDYVNYVYENLLHFIHLFLSMSGFNEYHIISPDFLCKKCNYKNAEIITAPGGRKFKVEQPFKFEIVDKKYKHGLIFCPKCNFSQECYLGDMERFGIS